MSLEQLNIFPEEVLVTSRVYAHAYERGILTQEQYHLLFVLLIRQIPTVPTPVTIEQTQL